MNKRQIRDKVSEIIGSTRPQLPIDVSKIAQNFDAEIRYVAFDDSVSGMLFREGQRTIIGVNAGQAPVRRRFTIAHELGHLILHSEQSVHVDHNFTVRMRDGKSSLAVDIHEIEANSFAAELLMPTSLLLEDVQGVSIDYERDKEIKDLAEKYGVSTQAMTLRLANLGIIET